jgi:hypothetical protein
MESGKLKTRETEIRETGVPGSVQKIQVFYINPGKMESGKQESGKVKSQKVKSRKL